MTVVATEINDVDLWESVWGSEGSGITYWCDRIRKPDVSDIDLWVKDENGNFVGNPQDFKLRVFDEATGDVTWHLITVADLANAYAKALANGETHCGVSLSFEDSDECFGDIVLQYACFGEMVYG